MTGEGVTPGSTGEGVVGVPDPLEDVGAGVFPGKIGEDVIPSTGVGAGVSPGTTVGGTDGVSGGTGALVAPIAVGAGVLPG